MIHANGGKAAVYGLALRRHLKAPLIWMKHDHSYEGRLTHALGARCDHVGLRLARDGPGVRRPPRGTGSRSCTRA